MIYHHTLAKKTKSTIVTIIPVLAIVSLILSTSWILVKYGFDFRVILIIPALMLTLLILQNPWHGYLLLIFSLPFIGIGTIEIGASVIPSRLIGLLTVIGFFLPKLFEHKKLKRMPFDHALILFLIIVIFISIINYPRALATGASRLGGFGRNPLGRSLTQLIALTLMISIYFLSTNILNNKKRIITFIRVLLVTTFIITLYGYYQFIGPFYGLPYTASTYRVIAGRYEFSGDVGGINRIASTCGEAKGFAFFLLPIIFLVISMIWLKPNYRIFKRSTLVFLFLCFMGAFILTFARSGWLLFAASFILTVLLIGKFASNQKESLIGFLKILLIIFVSVAVIQSAVNIIYGRDLISLIVSRIESVPEGWTKASDSIRFDTTLKLLLPNLILGVGWGNTTFFIPFFDTVEIAPNQYLNILFETGIIGLGVFLWFLMGTLFYTIQALKKSEGTPWQKVILSLFIMVCSFLVSLMYNSQWFNNPLFWVMLGALKASTILETKVIC